jgi:general secretion pathway protein G
MTRVKKKKRAMTLLEIMIVIFIIGIISSVIGYNMKGSLEKAKAFKTGEGIKKIKEIFELELAQGSTNLNEIITQPAKVLQNSGLVTNAKDMLKDGWGVAYSITASPRGMIQVKSAAYDRYKEKHKKPVHDEEIAAADEEHEDQED